MQIPELRRVLASIALSIPTACIGDCPPIDELVLIGDMPDAELAPLVASCKQDDTCEPLCSKVFERQRGYLFEPADLLQCNLTVDGESSQDMVHYRVKTECIGGRRPDGYRGTCGSRHAGAYLALQAELEAASVRAFADLHADLRAIGAPAWLLRAVIAAAADEVRHAATCDRLARRHGGAPHPRMVPAARRRTRAQIASANLVEGCIRETYGAVVASYQARAAKDPVVRSAMRQIAADEARHAVLSWKLHQWLWPQLSPAEQHAARTAATAAMLSQLDATVWATI